MNIIKKFCQRFFIDGLSGMALGLFSTLIVGTILKQIALIFPGMVATVLLASGAIASSLMGAGIGCGVAYKLKESPLVVFSAATSGMIGAFASKIIAGTLIVDGVVQYAGPGEPLGAFLAAYAAIEVGHFISGKTSVDIVLTPLVTIGTGSFVGVLMGPPISDLMTNIGEVINRATNENNFVMGILVSVIMGMALTLPISSAALGLILKLNGLAAGAATVGCCANMIGFAVASYKENGFGGFIAQGLGTSMLQISNIVKKPIIWLPAILSSAVIGPLSTVVFKMTNNSVGSGMGTAGLVGQVTTYSTMMAGEDEWMVLMKIALLHFILPAVLSYGISEFMRKKGWIKTGDMKLDV